MPATEAAPSMELLLYLAEFQDAQGEVDDPLEVDRLMQSEAIAPNTDVPKATEPKLPPKSTPDPRRPKEPADNAP